MTIEVSLNQFLQMYTTVDCKYERLGDRFEKFVLVKLNSEQQKLGVTIRQSLMISFRSLPQAHIIVWDLGTVLELYQSSQKPSSHNRNRDLILSTHHHTVDALVCSGGGYLIFAQRQPLFWAADDSCMQLCNFACAFSGSNIDITLLLKYWYKIEFLLQGQNEYN
ncbi:hypothetical protein T11_5512 [Trichinella zimbabwensis]|uniref:Uncharacterized protein n=1 Tax=Trichinella zimbabwensis TaxID=268475 RepID=A0A0V1H2F0_9BILA|nr:hypothetical protein T11_5512 [Trichinella zimbabwensis]